MHTRVVGQLRLTLVTSCGSRIDRPAIRSAAGSDSATFRAIAQPGTNVFVIKTSFWLPVK
jgi:hypothetical protein